MASPNLLGLPQELRDQIYRFATKRINLFSNICEDVRDSVFVDHGPIPEMLAVNKKIQDEYMDAISSKTVLVFYPRATPMFRLDLPKVMRKDIPSTFLKSITQCEISLFMGAYMGAWLDATQEQEEREGISGHEIPLDEYLCPMIQIMLETLENVISPSAKLRILLDALDPQDCVIRPPLVRRLFRVPQRLHLLILKIFKGTILKQFIQEGHGDWPQPGKFQVDFSMVTSLYSTLDSDATDDVEPGPRMSAPQVLWKLVPTEKTEEHYNGFIPEMVRVLDQNKSRSEY